MGELCPPRMGPPSLHAPRHEDHGSSPFATLPAILAGLPQNRHECDQEARLAAGVFTARPSGRPVEPRSPLGASCLAESATPASPGALCCRPAWRRARGGATNR